MQALAAAPTSGIVDLSWLAPGDDGQSGVASRYDMFWRNTPFTEADTSDSGTVNRLQPTPPCQQVFSKASGPRDLKESVTITLPCGPWMKMTTPAL